MLHPHAVGLADIPPGEPVVFFLRDPLARLVSGFHSRRRQGRPRYDVPWTAAEATAFARFPDVNALGLGLAAGLPEAMAALHGIGHVASRLAAWLVDAATLEARRDDLLFIGFQEKLTADAAILAGLLGLPSPPLLPEDAVLAHRGLPTDDGRLDPAAEAALRRHLAADYALFEHCRQLRARMDTLRAGLAAAATSRDIVRPTMKDAADG